jgi:imidazolonepropionase
MLAERSLLVRGARQLLTMRGSSGPRRGDALQQLGLIEDGSVLITNGAITNVGSTRRLENLAEAKSADEINATGRVVMPAFNDAYLRLIAPPARMLEYPTGLNATMVTPSDVSRAAQQYLRGTPPGRLEFQARRILERCVRHGTTSIEAKCGYGLDDAAEMKALRAASNVADASCSLVPTFVACPPATPADGDMKLQIDWICGELLPKIRQRRLALCTEVVCDPDGFNVDQARTLLRTAHRLGFKLKIQAEQTTRMGAVRLAAEMDVRTVSGLNYCDQRDAEMLARSGAIATLLPTPVYRGREAAYPPARMLIDAGVPVALASGYSPTLPAMSTMQAVLSFACTELAMTPEEAINAATINAAHAMNLAAKTGSLEFGKHADLIMLDVPDYHEIPYYLGVNHVEMTMCKGQVVYSEGAVTWPAG